MTDLTAVESHFQFGENWQSFLSVVDEDRIVQAELGLLKLIDRDRIAGASFLDVGCGAGIHLLAAARLGAGRLVGVDIDPNSVAATRTLFERAAPHVGAEVSLRSALDLRPESDGQYDIVYSWGVLHHTGAMWPAIETVSALVKPKGLFVLALYQRTKLCRLWQIEKRIYSRAPKLVQRLFRAVYVGALRVYYWLRGWDFAKYVETYRSQRGMDFAHDVHDWLGGYPYESVTTAKVREFANKHGFRIIRQFDFDGVGRGVGLFGTACAEFVLERVE
jgi:SAM-dependent methyltransferase